MDHRPQPHFVCLNCRFSAWSYEWVDAHEASTLHQMVAEDADS